MLKSLGLSVPFHSNQGKGKAKQVFHCVHSVATATVVEQVGGSHNYHFNPDHSPYFEVQDRCAWIHVRILHCG